MEDRDGLRWRKSTFSGGNGSECVEIGTDDRTPVVHVRDTKSRERGMLTVSSTVWQRFMADLKAGHASQPQALPPDTPERPTILMDGGALGCGCYLALISVMSRKTTGKNRAVSSGGFTGAGVPSSSSASSAAVTMICHSPGPVCARIVPAIHGQSARGPFSSAPVVGYWTQTSVPFTNVPSFSITPPTRAFPTASR